MYTADIFYIYKKKNSEFVNGLRLLSGYLIRIYFTWSTSTLYVGEHLILSLEKKKKKT